jgi:hypothetical protein
MRTTLSLSDRAVRDAKAYMANADPVHAIESLIDSYGRLVAELRKLRSRSIQFDAESAELDSLVSSLRQIARSIDQL